MNRTSILFVAVLAVVPTARPGSPPLTRSDGVIDKLHGTTITDPYRWLENQGSPETRAWIDQQNAYTRSALDALPGRDQIRQRLGELLKIDTAGVPIQKGGRYFFLKRLAGQNQFVLTLRRGLHGKDEVLIDPNAMSADQTSSVSLLEVSRDGKWLVYGLRQGGEDELTVSVMDVDSRKDLPDRLPRARYNSFSLKPDKSGFYYARLLKEGSRLYYHAMGTDPARDSLIFGENYGPEQWIDGSLSVDGRYLLVQVAHGSNAKKVDLYVQDLGHKGPITTIVNTLDAMFLGEIGGDQLIVHTNWQAPNGRVLSIDLAKPERKNWREIVPESSATIDKISLAGGKVAVNYLDNVQSRVRIFEISGKSVRDIRFPTLGTVTQLFGRWDSDEAFYAFTSFVQPPTLYRYQVSSGTQDVWFHPQGPVDSSRFEVKQVWYASKDRTRIPMFLVHQKGLRADRGRPTLLTGYGGFNISLRPQFSATATVWAESGGVFAVANLRGGGEFGEKWHQAGMLGQKQNVFDDFISAAEWLIESGYTRPERLAITGTSNGGLLVGAALTQRPELFQAVVCRYPLLDMLRYQQFLVARLWVSEYGSADDPKQFESIYRYSPYHNVKDGVKYPAVLLVTGDSDTRVDPLHARKMAARLQAATRSDRPVLLHYDTKAGHSGGLPVTKQIDDLTDEISFLLGQLERN